METKSSVTFLNLSANLQMLLALNGFQYIFDLRKENAAINKFMQDGISADYVVDLIGKLIAIKRHHLHGKEVFWKSCAVNIADAYSYRVKIETVWESIKQDREDYKKSLEESKQTVSNVVVSVEPKIKKSNWKDFLDWTKRNLSSSSIIAFKGLNTEESESEIKILNPVSQIQANIIQTFFQDSGIEIVFRGNI